MAILQRIQYCDERILRWITENLRLSWLNKLMSFYTGLGNGGWIFIAISVVLLCVRKTRRAGASALASMGCGLLVTNIVLKPLVARMRPWVVMEGLVPLVTSRDMNSFPSGHTCAAFAFGMAICTISHKKWVKAAALAAAALMGFSRLYVGVHFPTDVLAGAIIGVICGLVGSWGVSRIISRRVAG